MTRDTSIEAYQAIKNSGLLGEIQFTVYDFVHHNGPVTAKKAIRYFDDNNSSIVPRFAELEDMGLITTDGTELCEETNRPNQLWITTGNLPNKKVKKPTRKEKKEATLNLIADLGNDIPEEYKQRLRVVYHSVKNL